MDIAFKCPLCEQDFHVEAALAGTEFRCPTCLKVTLVPEEAPMQAAALAPLEADSPAPNIVPQSDLPPPPPVPAIPKIATRLHTLGTRPPTVDAEDARLARRLTEAYQRVTAEVGKLIVGQ